MGKVEEAAGEAWAQGFGLGGRGGAESGRRLGSHPWLCSARLLTLLEVEKERRERKRAGGAGDFGRGRERRAGLGLLVEWAHGDGHTPATAWRAAAAATVELNQGSVSMAGKDSKLSLRSFQNHIATFQSINTKVKDGL